jgi:flagellum-specific peptidoglycan hydrolase FlgJ
MGQVLKNRVGPKGPHDFDDIQLVQTLLNNHLAELVPLGPLNEDGKFGPKTAQAILAFQRDAMRWEKTDGVVDPGGATLKALLGERRIPHAAPAHVQKFLKLALPGARKTKKRWGVPIAVLLAQAAQETGWGRKVVDNAYFGIKGKSPTGAATKFNTTEVLNGKVVKMTDTFRAYESFEEAAEDYGRFLNEQPRYAGAFAFRDDPIKFAEAVAKAGYATDPHYAASLTRIIVSRRFDRYDR